MKKILLLLISVSLFSACYLELSQEEIDQLQRGGKIIEFDWYTVEWDNNEDAAINKGETVYIDVFLKNVGTNTAKAVEATFSTNSSYVSGFLPSGPVSYGDISPEEPAYGSSDIIPEKPTYIYTLKFTVSNTTPVDTKIPITINITDEDGNTWVSGFDLPVEAISAQIVYADYDVVDDDNGDKIVNKGETVYLRVNLKNKGTSVAKKVKAVFSTTSAYVSEFAPASSVNYDDIQAGSVNDHSFGNYLLSPNYQYYTIKFKVSGVVSAGTSIPVNIDISDENDNTWTDSFNVVVGGEEPELAYDKYVVVADNNGNKKIEKGETVYLQVFLKNIGSGAADMVNAVFSTGNAYISGLSPVSPVDYGDYTGGLQSKYGQGGYDFGAYYTIKLTVSNTVQSGAQLPVGITITGAGGRVWTDSFNVAVE